MDKSNQAGVESRESFGIPFEIYILGDAEVKLPSLSHDVQLAIVKGILAKLKPVAGNLGVKVIKDFIVHFKTVEELASASVLTVKDGITLNDRAVHFISGPIWYGYPILNDWSHKEMSDYWIERSIYLREDGVLLLLETFYSISGRNSINPVINYETGVTDIRLLTDDDLLLFIKKGGFPESVLQATYIILERQRKSLQNRMDKLLTPQTFVNDICRKCDVQLHNSF